MGGDWWEVISALAVLPVICRSPPDVSNFCIDNNATVALFV